MLKCCVVNTFSGPWFLWPATNKACLQETLDRLLVETQFVRQTLTVHACEPLPVPQIVDFNGDLEKHKVRVFKPLAGQKPLILKGFFVGGSRLSLLCPCR